MAEVDIAGEMERYKVTKPVHVYMRPFKLSLNTTLCRCTKVTTCVTGSMATVDTAGLQEPTFVATLKVISERVLVCTCLPKERDLR